MRPPLMLVVLLMLTSGCAVIPAKPATRSVDGAPATIERPAVGMYPFGEGGGQLRFRGSLRKKEIRIEYRLEF